MQLPPALLFRGVVVASVAAAWLVAPGRRGVAPAVVLTFVAIALLAVHAQWLRAHARRVVLAHPLPGFLRAKLRGHYPQLTDTQALDVERALRQFFVASACARGRFVAMPSKVVDALWHEFILHTRGYEVFCRKAFGRLLHHTPAEAMPAGGRHGDRRAGLRRAWYWSCREEGIDPSRPDRLPLLFALDAALAIPGGYRYVPDCSLLGADRGQTHCGAGFGCGSSCGSSSDGGSDGGSGCGSSCSSGCGGGD
jgi:hypothetical protein